MIIYKMVKQHYTNNQFITNHPLAQTTADTTTLKNHLNDHITSYGESTKKLTADAEYESEENYTDLKKKKSLPL